MARYQNLNKIFDLLKNFQFDPELPNYKQSLIRTSGINKFLTLNNQFFLVFDISSHKLIYISDNISDMMGWDPDTITLQFIYNQIVSADRNHVIDATRYALIVCSEHPEINTLVTTFEMDFRIRKMNGSIIRLTRKSCVLKKDKKGFPVLFLSLYTDISNYKNTDSIVITAEGPDKHLFHFVKKNVLKPKNGKFTGQEILILKKLTEGKGCKTIADEMNIKVSTVSTHCKNMLGKSDYRKMNGLVAFAIRELHLL